MLTSVVVFVYPGDAAQIAVTIVVNFIFFGVLEALSPYESRRDMWMSRAGHLVVFFSFFAALLYKVDISDENKPSQSIFAVTMVAVHGCLIAVWVVNVAVTCFAAKRAGSVKPLARARSSVVQHSPRRQRTPSSLVAGWLDEGISDRTCEVELSAIRWA